MRAMVLEAAGDPLKLRDIPVPVPGAGQVLIRVEACGVCRTDLHILDGELTAPRLPLVPGHEIVGRIEKTGEDVTGLRPGQRVGVPWLGHACGRCPYCGMGRENLCDAPLFTGYTFDGGYADYCLAHTDFIFAIFAEELGFIGVVVLIGLFMFLFVRGVQVAFRADNAFARYLAIGVVASIAIPTIFNLWVVTGLLPTKGLPLPLISYGGSNVLATLLSLGLLIGVSRTEGETP